MSEGVGVCAVWHYINISGQLDLLAARHRSLTGTG